MSGIRVFPTDKRDWTLKLSIGNKISQLSNKDHPARKLSIQPAISKRQPTQVSINETFRNKINTRILGIFSIGFDLI